MRSLFILPVIFILIILVLKNTHQRAHILPRIHNTLQLQNIPPNARILDVGGGNGKILHALRAHYTHATSIDLPGAAKGAVQPYDGHHIPFPNATFDVVMCVYVLHHVPHAPELLAEMHRVAKTGALLLLYEDVPPTSLLAKIQAAIHYAYFQQSHRMYETAMHAPQKWTQLLHAAGWNVRTSRAYSGTWHYALQHVEILAQKNITNT